MTDPRRPRDGDDPTDPQRPGIPPHQPLPDGETDAQDERNKDSFPSSDPPSTGSPGI